MCSQRIDPAFEKEHFCLFDIFYNNVIHSFSKAGLTLLLYLSTFNDKYRMT